MQLTNYLISSRYFPQTRIEVTFFFFFSIFSTDTLFRNKFSPNNSGKSHSAVERPLGRVVRVVSVRDLSQLLKPATAAVLV